MPAYLAKVTNAKGLVKPPMVVACADEEKARQLLQAALRDGDVLEFKGLLPFEMTQAFAHLPEGEVVFRYDWIWPADGSPPKPY